MDSIKTVDVDLYIESLINDEHIVKYKGIHINYKNKFYIITIYHGLPVKYVKINNIKITDFIISKWNDLLIIPLNFVHDNIFIFKHFIKKDLDINEKCMSDDNKLKFIENTFSPIHEIPGNPVIMYNVFKHYSNNIFIAGEPVYNTTDGLYGIIAQSINNTLIVVPSIYILMTLDKNNNIIYSLDEKIYNIYKINNYKILNDKIYCQLHKSYIPIECYIVFNCDSDIKIKININNIDRYGRIIEFKNPNIILSNSIIRHENTIKLTSSLMHLLKELEEFEILERLFSYLTRDNYIQYNQYIIHA